MVSTISHNIKIIRGLTGDKQEDFAKKFKNVSRSMQQSYESGKAVPDVLYLSTLAKLAGVSIEELSNEIVDETKVQIVENIDNVPHENKNGFKKHDKSGMQYTPITSSDKKLSIAKSSEKQPSDKLEDTIKAQAETILLLTRMLDRKLENG